MTAGDPEANSGAPFNNSQRKPQQRMATNARESVNSSFIIGMDDVVAYHKENPDICFVCTRQLCLGDLMNPRRCCQMYAEE
ncbi:hypothetical protein NECAME_09487 [Necator americanus]|uniref:Uncharacterized protein n=1 Tax=Necator americanus TaxID=51031 RepID=W2TD29_NECAM|nr:hypothetical protein NECAME_09487 [Necator americanus]ETN79950.1 hypothetical protein NECAME_09487 [Necator americanus]